MSANSLLNLRKHKGFTLVELIIGIVIFSVAIVTITSVIMPQTRQAIDPLWQVRAVTLGQSLLNEISAKAFDEASITDGGRRACDDGITSCTSSSALGPEAGESRNSFDDIDDYNGLPLSGEIITNAPAGLSDLFRGFQARISVVYDQDANGINDDDTDNDGTLDSGSYTGNQKLITVTIITPGGEEISFAALRKNV